MQHIAVLGIVIMGICHSFPGENIKQRVFHVTFPSNTFPLLNTGDTHIKPSIIKDTTQHSELHNMRSNSLIDEKLITMSIGGREDLDVNTKENNEDYEEVDGNEFVNDSKRNNKALLHQFPFKQQEGVSNTV